MECPNCGAEINDDAVDCSQCNHSLKKDKPKKKACWLATLSILCCIIGIPISVHIVSVFIETFVVFFCPGIFVVVSLLGITALIKIYRSNKTLGGKRRAIAAVVISAFILGYFFPATIMSHIGIDRMRRATCMANLYCLGLAIQEYADAHNEMLPEAGKWCDLLITNKERSISPSHLTCRGSEDEYGESSYALNKNATGKKLSDLPPKMVLLFETKHKNEGAERTFPIKSRGFIAHLEENDFIFEQHQFDKVYKLRWNQVGGADLLKLGNHEDHAGVLFANGKTAFVASDKLSELQWKIEKQEVDPATHLNSIDKTKILFKIVAIAVIGLLMLGGMVVVVCKYWAAKEFFYALVLGLISAGIGCIFGSWAEFLYPVNDVYRVGMYVGGSVGFVVGICYAMILTGIPTEFKKQRGFKGYASSLGMVAGSICSTIVHLILMIAYGETTPLGMISGLPYGIVAGAIFGRICGAILKQPSTTPCVDESIAKSGEQA